MKTRKLLILRFAELAKPHNNGSFVSLDTQTRYSDRVPVHRGEEATEAAIAPRCGLQKQHRHIALRILPDALTFNRQLCPGIRSSVQRGCAR